MAMPRWVLHDPATAETWTFPMSPNKMTSPHPPKAATIFSRNVSQADDAGGINRVLMQRRSPYEWQFSGVIRTEAQHDDFKDWLRRTGRLEITDHFSRTWSVRFDSVEINEQKPTFRNNWRYEYTAKAIIYGRVS